VTAKRFIHKVRVFLVAVRVLHMKNMYLVVILKLLDVKPDI
jgi:hypothetical protein